MTNSNLTGAWERFWGTIAGSGGIGTLFTILAWVGVVLIVMGVVKFIWDKRRGGGGNSQQLLWTLVVGGVLAAPNLLIPLLLRIIDIVINLIATLLRAV